MVEKIPAMTDMKRTPIEQVEAAMPQPSEYPYGLSICFDNETLEKLNLDGDDVEVGDFIHIHSLAKVTSVSCNESEATGKNRRIELCMCYISAEDEDEEDEEEEKQESYHPHKRY